MQISCKTGGVYFGLKEKVQNAADIRKAFPGYDVIYGIFSKSGFTDRMKDVAGENETVILIQEDRIEPTINRGAFVFS